ncbi:hypothetical protein B0T21DRAFT_410283 [Apiosordaria backusii]|uniref:Uncharacterized protein n=1 Tax=Apiosordaria backusii TaxID=314023 RepID=A0AA40BTE4_9PEZI|nr:hypothetical protein B0T21DRAFT_410283 [Apiosordaria backusii]
MASKFSSNTSSSPPPESVNNGSDGSNRRLGITVFSGGTAANNLVDLFNRIARPSSSPPRSVTPSSSSAATTSKNGDDDEPYYSQEGNRQRQLNYIIPISDNGGSSSELIRFVGGPSVGDIRSRLVRLIPSNLTSRETSSLRVLFEHRLSPDPIKARGQWAEIVESRSLLWAYISGEKKELIRSVLNILNAEIVKRARPPNVFNFAGASVGNMFLTGARLLTGSFEAGIYLLRMICEIPSWVRVLPAVNSNHTHHISAGWVNNNSENKGEKRGVLTGQVAISHPSEPTSIPDEGVPSYLGLTGVVARLEDDDEQGMPGSLPVLRRQNLKFSKEEEEDLPGGKGTTIERVWYINLYGHEIMPKANSEVVRELREGTEVVVYSVGSLYTSIVPSLILKEVGESIETVEGIRKKVLILNSKLDRETRGMDASAFIKAIWRACVECRRPGDVEKMEWRRVVTHLVYIDPAQVEQEEMRKDMPQVDADYLETLGIHCAPVQGRAVGEGKARMMRYDEEDLRETLERIINL